MTTTTTPQTFVIEVTHPVNGAQKIPFMVLDNTPVTSIKAIRNTGVNWPLTRHDVEIDTVNPDPFDAMINPTVKQVFVSIGLFQEHVDQFNVATATWAFDGRNFVNIYKPYSKHDKAAVTFSPHKALRDEMRRQASIACNTTDISLTKIVEFHVLRSIGWLEPNSKYNPSVDYSAFEAWLAPTEETTTKPKKGK